MAQKTPHLRARRRPLRRAIPAAAAQNLAVAARRPTRPPREYATPPVDLCIVCQAHLDVNGHVTTKIKMNGWPKRLSWKRCASNHKDEKKTPPHRGSKFFARSSQNESPLAGHGSIQEFPQLWPLPPVPNAHTPAAARAPALARPPTRSPLRAGGCVRFRRRARSPTRSLRRARSRA
jgi:hypothetical protein